MRVKEEPQMEESKPEAPAAAPPPTAPVMPPEAPKKKPWVKIAAIIVVIVVIVAALAVVFWPQPRANQAPEITQVTVSAEVAEVGQTLTFTAQATDPDGDALTYKWDFGDASNGTGDSATHAYALPGRFIALLTVSDGKGGETTNDNKLLFLQINRPLVREPTADNETADPVAILSADKSVIQTDTTVKFNGNASWVFLWSWYDESNHSKGGQYGIVTAGGDTDSTVFDSLTYSWGDDTADVSGNATKVGETSHQFTKTGNFFVKLTVTHRGTHKGYAGYTIRVQPTAPPTFVKNPDVFTTVTIGEPDYLDPAVDYETAGGEVLQNVYETLVWYEEGSEGVTTLVPRLATEVPTVQNGLISADGLNYTFNLRAGVKFHNGETMTADDVEFSIERVLAIFDPDGPSWMLEQILTNYISAYADAGNISDWVDSEFASRADVPAHFRAVLPAESQWDTTPLTVSLAWAISNSSVEKVDSDTVVFHLTHPYPAFLQIAAYTVMSIVSKKAVMDHGGVVWGTHNDWMDENAVGTGPFKFKVWQPNQMIILERWDQYWRTPAKLKQVNIVKANDVATRELMLLAGDADSAYVPRNHQYDVMNLDGTPKYDYLRIVKDKPTFTVLFFGYNQNINTAATPDPLLVSATFFSDIHVRKAFSYAFDYNSFILNVIYGGGKQLKGPIPEGMLGFNSSLPLFTYDLAKVESELKLAQNPDQPGQTYWQTGFEITLYYNAGNTVREEGTLLLKKGLEAMNDRGSGTITVKTTALDWPVYLATLRAKALPIFFLGWAPDYADPDDYAFPFLHSRGTFPQRVGYSNATIDQMVEDAAKELDPAKREQMYKDLQGIVVTEHVPYLWIYQATNFHVERTWVQGYYFNPMLSGGYYYLWSKA